MIRYFITILVLSSIFQNGLAQKHTLSIRDDGWHSEYLIDSMVVTHDQFMKEMYTNPQAKSAFKKGKRQNVFSGIVAYTGGFMIGWQLGNLLANKPLNSPSLIIGIGVSLSAFAIQSTSIHSKQKAIDIYNQSL